MGKQFGVFLLVGIPTLFIYYTGPLILGLICVGLAVALLIFSVTRDIPRPW